jgi:hypothetical protein
MKRLFLTLLILMFALPAYAVPPVPSSTIAVASNCNVAAYFPLGKLCQDSDDGKLYKGTGAAIEEIIAGTPGDVSSDSIWDAAGDTVYGTGANTAAKLAKGTAYQLYMMNSGATAPAWTSTLGATGTRLTAGYFTNIYGTGMTTGVASTTAGTLVFLNATNANAFTITSGVSGAAIGWTLPTAAPGGANYLLNVDADGTMGYTDPAGLGGGYTNLTSFIDQTAWRVFYSDGSGDVKELALGSDGTYLRSNGASSAPTFDTPTGAAHDALTLGATATDILGLSTQELGFDTQTANYVLAGPTTGAAAAPTFRALVSGDIPNNAADTSGNAGTATALAADPADCAAGQIATGIAASGALSCTATPSGLTSVGATTFTGALTGTATGLAGTPNITVGTINAGGGGMTVDADGDVVVKSLISISAAATGGYLRLSEGSDNGTDYSSITGKADAGTYPAFTFGGSQGSEDLTLTAASDKWTIASTSGATVGITPATNIVGALSLGTAGAAAASLVLNNATSGAVTISPITGALGSASLVVGTTFTDAKWCSYATATGFTCKEDAPAGSGDVTDVGNCSSGNCLDGTSDGGTQILLYDAQGATTIAVGDNSGAVTLTLPTTTGTLATRGANTFTGTQALADQALTFTTGYIAMGADPADAGAIRLPNAGYIYSEADAAGTDISVIGVDSSEVIQIGASGASAVKITPSTSIGPAAPDDVRPTLSIIGDADSDAADTTEALTVTLTANADPTLATWGFTSTQSAGYTFDKPVQAPAKFVSFTGAATLTAAAHNGALVMMTTADEVTMWDCTSTTIGHWVTLWARDAEKIEVVPATDDQFYTFAGTGIGANDELDMAATAGTKVTLMCTAASEWRVVYETAACADGGAAD